MQCAALTCTSTDDGATFSAVQALAQFNIGELYVADHVGSASVVRRCCNATTFTHARRSTPR